MVAQVLGLVWVRMRKGQLAPTKLLAHDVRFDSNIEKLLTSKIGYRDFEALHEQLKKMNIPFTNWEEIVNLDKIKEFYHQKLEEIQHSLSGFEKVRKFTLMPAEFEVGTGEITPTLKIKRNIVLEKYKELIEKMYQH